MAVDQARETALKILIDINENGAYSNIALDKHLESSALSGRDRAFITELVYGTVKWKLTLDWLIGNYSRIRMKKMSPWILNILRLGIYQLLYTSKVPVSAACNESVNLAAKYGHKASAGFVNAILRNVARNKNNPAYPDRSLDNTGYLSVRYSHPEWMVKKFLGLFGDNFTESLLEADNNTPDVTVRVNTFKTSADAIIRKFESEGIQAFPGRYLPEALILKNASSIARLEAFKEGLIQVQDESSMLAARVLDPKPGEQILDACSAPGGKTTHIAALMDNRGKVVARDIHRHKINLVNEAAERLGFDIVKTEVCDSSISDGNSGEIYDRVLLDAPCSGLGVIRKKPDIKWTRGVQNQDMITGLQRRLISAVSQYVKPGGVFVYSTCTIVPEENGGIVGEFLKSHPDFYPDDISLYLPGELAGYAEDDGTVQLYPNRDGVDGFFIARLGRRG